MSSRFSNRRVVFDTGPLIAFAHLDGFRMLNQLFEQIHITETVFYESQFDKERDDAKTIIAALESRYLIRTPANASINIMPPAPLGNGEITSIQLARALSCPVILDDKQARNHAHKLSIPVIGTAGLLVHAKHCGHLRSATKALTRLQEKGYYLSDDLILRIKQLTNE